MIYDSLKTATTIIHERVEGDYRRRVHTVGTGLGKNNAEAKATAAEAQSNAKRDDQETAYNQLAAALGDSGPVYSYDTGPKYGLPRAADAILELVPPPTSEVDEASWGAFLNGEEGGN